MNKKITSALVLIFALPIAAHALPPVRVLPISELIVVNNEWINSSPHHNSLWAKGLSMLPYAKNGDTFLVEKRGFNTPIYKGYLITYLDKGELVTHEVIEVKGGWVLPKGLNNSRPDNWISISRVRYIVMGVLRQGEWVVPLTPR